MSLVRLVWAFIRRRPGNFLFHVLTLSLGASVVLGLVLLERAVETRFSRDLAGVDLVIGAKGSPMQVILSALLEVDTPTGNIPLSAAEHFAQHPLVKFAVPVSLGDNVRGVRIVGTRPAYGELYGAHLAQGAWWTRPMEAVLGADAARRLGLRPGDSFIGEHGLTAGGERHAKTPYHVVGVLAATASVIDELVLTDISSVWEVHSHKNDPDEPENPGPPQVTALLVKYRSAMGAIILPPEVRAMPDLQPAVPAVEVARLVVMLGVGARALEWIGIVLLLLSAGGFLVALISAVSERRQELALLRAMGAHPGLLLRLVTLEGVVLGLAGGVLGVVLSRILLWGIATAGRESGMRLAPPPLGTLELLAVGLAMALGLLAALPPALRARFMDPGRELA